MLLFFFFYFERGFAIVYYYHIPNLLKRAGAAGSEFSKFVNNMKSKEEIVQNWLPRYTGEKLENFGKYILLTNFSNYVRLFAEWNDVEIIGIDKPMQCATWDG